MVVMAVSVPSLGPGAHEVRRDQKVARPVMKCYKARTDREHGTQRTRARVEELMTNLRRMAVLPVAVLVLAACQSDGSGSSASPSGGGGTADITNVVCVGEATTYLDWLNGDFQPDDALS